MTEVGLSWMSCNEKSEHGIIEMTNEIIVFIKKVCCAFSIMLKAAKNHKDYSNNI